MTLLVPPTSPAIHKTSFRFAALLALAGAITACGSGTEDAGGAGNGDANSGSSTGGQETGSGGAGNASGGTGIATGGTGTGTGGLDATGGTGAGGSPPDLGPSHVVIVAHQDDDLLFINPELKRVLDRNEVLTTAYVTSGNAGLDMTYVTERELGIRSAYAFMAGTANSWTCGTGSYAGKTINECSLNGTKNVKLIFFRLVDGWGNGSDPNSIAKLWTGAISSSAAVDGSGLSFTRAELVASLADVLAQRSATEVHTTDFSFQNRANDHSDHENAALFSVAASGTYTAPHGLHSYLTYGTTDYPENLSAADQAIVGDTFSYYAACDSELPGCSGGAGCDQTTCSTSSTLYQSWYSRLYSFSRGTPPVSATLIASGGGCLNAAGGAATIGSCGGTIWTWGADYTLKSAEGLCLTAPPLSTGSNLSVSACSGSSHQRWFVMDNGQVVLGAAPDAADMGGYVLAQCLDASFGMGATASVSDCSAASSLEWTL